ncbi:MAG: ImmA/IrrE family metallo-endopeptidase [Chthoniobacter sp.]|nr:ImmA/IrrE family metallo-endopeptidase [Chthoniobacter sp.]
MENADPFEPEVSRALLDQLLADSKLYTQSKHYKDLLDFVIKLRNFAPFNAMLLQVQKPGLGYAASSRDWRERFGRSPKNEARPLLILWPFGPVALVYDVMDTEGKPLPEDVACYVAKGTIDGKRLAEFDAALGRKNIECYSVDAGDRRAGMIELLRKAGDENEANLYRIHINRNHAPAVKFVTLAHELGHLFLGHLGPDRRLKVPLRPPTQHAQRELEAESVAYLVCGRNGVVSKSETYLANFVRENTTVEHLDLYQVMRAAGQVESLLGLTAHTKFSSTRGQQETLAFGLSTAEP